VFKSVPGCIEGIPGHYGMFGGMMGCFRGVPGLFRAVPVVFRGVPGVFRVLQTPLQAANSLLLAREHSPDVNNKPISISGTRLPLEHHNIQFESGILIPIMKSVPD